MFGSYDLRRNYQNGDRYHGEAVENGVFHGKGVLVEGATGNTYDGQWCKGKMQGQGSYVSKSEGWRYTGAFRDGLRAGHGACTWDNGTTYEGDWAAGTRTGSGTETIPGHSTYTGSFRDNLRCGEGRASYTATPPSLQDILGATPTPCGIAYSGAWDKGEWHGQGTLTTPGTTYTGSFHRNAVQGEGALDTPAWRYRGCVDRLLPHGAGKMVYLATAPPQGDSPPGPQGGDATAAATPTAGDDEGHLEQYEGNFCHGSRQGKGEGWLQDSWVYVGLWYDDLKHGHGRLATQDTLYNGEFVAGERCGQGTAESKRGAWTYRGAWKHDNFNGGGVLKLRLSQGDPRRLTACLRTGDRCVENTWLEYRGTLTEGAMTGAGAITLSSGYRYEGGVADGTFHGEGSLTSTALPELAYHGGFREGLFHGEGTASREGHSYKGAFAAGKYHGVGRLDLANGDYYEGGFVEGSFHGVGTWYEAATSDTYEGHWEGGAKEGEGIEIKYGAYHYAGCFRGNAKHGAGVIKFSNGDVYDGQFVAGAYHGRGALKFSNGSSYSGDFREGRREGVGAECLASGSRYEGEYRNDRYNGRGILTCSNNDRYDGDFREGLKHGQGTYIYREGSRLSCHWVDDVLHGEGVYHFPHESKPPTVRVYHQGNLVSEAPYVYEGASRNVLPPPADPVALSPERSEVVGSVRTRAAVEVDHTAAVGPLREQLASLEAEMAGSATPAQAYALKKKAALLKANIRREERARQKALGAYPTAA